MNELIFRWEVERDKRELGLSKEPPKKSAEAKIKAIEEVAVMAWRQLEILGIQQKNEYARLLMR